MATYGHAAPCPAPTMTKPKCKAVHPQPPQCAVLTVDTPSSCDSLGASLLDFGLSQSKKNSPSRSSRLGRSTTVGDASPTHRKTRFLPQFNLPGLPRDQHRLSATSLPTPWAAAEHPGPASPSSVSLSSWRNTFRPIQHSPCRQAGSASRPQPLTQEQKTLVRDTWQAAISRDVGLAAPGTQTPALDLFEAIYAHLFVLAPEAKLILGTRVRMCVKLARAIGLLLKCLDTPQRLRGLLADLAATHVSAGATPSMFTHLGTALCVGLRARLGNMWTPAVAKAWHAFYHMASDLLQSEMGHLLADPQRMAQWLADRVGGHQADMLGTWTYLTDTRGAFTETFFSQFMAACPQAKPLFNRAQPPHAALHTVIANLLRVVDNPDKLVTQLRGLGRLHAGIGLSPGMNTHFRTCFVDALRCHVPTLSREEAGAWAALVGLVAAHVVAAAHTHRRRGEACFIS